MEKERKKCKTLLQKLQKISFVTDLPEFRAGDTVRLHVKIVEGTRERIQLFEGVVIKRRGGGISETFTVRKISNGVGVERTFPVHTPKIAKLMLFVAVKYVVRNCTTFAVFAEKLHVSKKFDNNKRRFRRPSNRPPFFLPQI